MLISCDISGEQKKDRYLVLGSAWIPKEQLPKYEEAVCFFRIKNKLWGEIKWLKIEPQKINEFKEFLNISLQKFPFEIKIIVRDKKIKVPKGRFRNKGEMKSTFYYELINNHMKRALSRNSKITSFDVLLDKEGELRNQSLNLKSCLQFSLIRNGVKQSISHLSQCDSKICSALQLCDLVIGAVSAKLNQPSIKISKSKKEIIKYIEKILNHSLDKPTLPSSVKFNLWIWRPHR